MDMNQFTQKTVAALQRAQSLAIEYQHMQVEQEHLLLALTEDEAELIPQLLTRCGISVPSFVAGLKGNRTASRGYPAADGSRARSISPGISNRPWSRQKRSRNG